MDMQIMVSLDKTFYEGLPRLSILTGAFMCLQMSDRGQIQQQDTIPSFTSPHQHQLTVIEYL